MYRNPPEGWVDGVCKEFAKSRTFVPSICKSNWTERYLSSWRCGLWQKLVNSKPLGLVFCWVHCWRKVLLQGPCWCFFCSTHWKQETCSFPFGPVINHLCSEMHRCCCLLGVWAAHWAWCVHGVYPVSAKGLQNVAEGYRRCSFAGKISLLLALHLADPQSLKQHCVLSEV